MKKLTFTKKFSVKPVLVLKKKPVMKIPLSSLAMKKVGGKRYS